MYTPHTPAEKEKMLQQIGIKSIEDLFSDVPEAFRFPELDLPPKLTEMEALAEMQGLSSANESAQNLVSFLGAGAYYHYVPSVIDHMLRRGEFYTAYTPYQPEVSQGTLQAIFEYQTLIANLTGMEVSNASHYDGATATAEAGIMAYHNFRGKRSRFVISPAVHPDYRATLRTYFGGVENLEILGDEADSDPMADPSNLGGVINSNTAIVFVQYPDFFGRIYDYSKLAEKAHQEGAIFCVVANPLSLGMLKAPGEFGADIVVGDGQPLGIPLSFGGPYLGIFTTKKEFVRKIAGRLVGESVDKEGRRGYVLTLTAREQHIRREKATSNICSNQGLMALCSTIYMTLLGKQGLKQVAELCYQKAHYAAKKIAEIPGYNVCSGAPFFHEFVVCCPQPVEEINAHLLDHGIIGGYDLGKEFPTLKNHMLIAVTEMNNREEIDTLCEYLEEAAND